MYLYSHNENKRKDKMKTFLLVVVTVFITVVVIENIFLLMKNERGSYTAQRLSSDIPYYDYSVMRQDVLTSNITNTIETIKECTVGISTLKPDGENMLDINAAEKWGTGTGVIVSKNGYILTNQHLAQNVGAKMIVTMNNGEIIEGRVIWNEANIDLAIIKVNKNGLKAVTLGNSENIAVGEDVIAIGNPLGVEFQGTTTKGIISGLNRTFMFEDNGEKVFMEDLIQTDASINPGNSGGPLINSAGQVIGINTVKLSDAEGIGFAIPVNVVKPIIKKYEEDDEFKEANLGIYAHDKEVIPYMDSSLKLDRGIYVTSVDRYGPCGKAGIKVGDVILSIDGVEVDKMVELREYIYSKKPGDVVTLVVIDGTEKEVKVTLGEK